MTNDEIKAKLDRFVSSMEEETGFTQKQMRDILAEEGITVFSEENRSEIKAALRGRVAMKTKLIERIEEMDNQFPAIAHQCPVPGCTGTKVIYPQHSISWPWICSEGGASHYIIFRSATIMSNRSGADLDDTMIGLMEALSESETSSDTPI